VVKGVSQLRSDIDKIRASAKDASYGMYDIGLGFRGIALGYGLAWEKKIHLLRRISH
jgi:hypothetical protein